jgi:hypothetical protein
VTRHTIRSSPLLVVPDASVLKRVRICDVRFIERFCNCEMEWTQENVIELIELYIYIKK